MTKSNTFFFFWRSDRSLLKKSDIFAYQAIYYTTQVSLENLKRRIVKSDTCLIGLFWKCDRSPLEV